jgi:TRAP-type C4-dicarboxylate transport system substrate-binding protein
MIDTINTPPGSVEAYSWWEHLKYAQKPYQYYADAYIMANATWFDSLPKDLQDLLMTVGAEIGAKATGTIFDAGENSLKKFQAMGGIVTTLSGEEKAKFDKLMNEVVLPDMADQFDASALKAAQAFVASQ